MIAAQGSTGVFAWVSTDRGTSLFELFTQDPRTGTLLRVPAWRWFLARREYGPDGRLSRTVYTPAPVGGETVTKALEAAFSAWGHDALTLDIPEPDRGYNGWANHETWSVNLWMSNSEGTANYCADAAREALAHAWKNEEPERREEAALRALAERLRQDLEDAAEDALSAGCAGASLWADLLTSALHAVDWREVADAFLEDLPRPELVEDEEDETQ